MCLVFPKAGNCPAYELKLALIAASAQYLFLQCCYAAKTWDPCAILRRCA